MMRGVRRAGSAPPVLSLTFTILFMIQTAACVRTQEAAPAPPPSFELVGEWGQPGEGAGKLKQPASIAVDVDGLVYVADAGSGFVHKFDWSGQALFSFNHPRMKRPAGIAVDEGRAIYVADSEANGVFVFYPDGRLLREMRGGPGRRFRAPAGVAVDSSGFIYVADSGANRVQKFDPRGRFLKGWGKEGSVEGEFSGPGDIAVSTDGFVYVADTRNRRVQKFTLDGEFVAAWGATGDARDQIAQPTGVDASDRFLFLADGVNRRVQAWSFDGTLQHTDTLGERFRNPTEAPCDVAAGENGELLVLDSANPRVLRVKMNF